ncbi:MAG: AbrB/MazE/SpoVT family DNA-binding domain-containing protein [Deltaproteobacteria bacterium]|nr:AbrB/MazE/SpoVT family DNA-binding domain-containing protein [Deltaproteobacteria bacterium]
MRITSKGQVTIPQEIRDEMGLLPNTEVEFIVEGNTVRIVKISAQKGESRGHRALRQLRGRARVTMSTEEIMELTRGDT